MQSENERSQVVHTSIFEDQEDLKRNFFSEVEKAEANGAVSHTVGKLPSRGESVEIHGLKYIVKNFNQHTGKLNLRLESPANKQINRTQTAAPVI